MEARASLGNIFRTQDEQLEPVRAKIEGQIPEWLNGTYLRVGPGKFDLGDITIKHYLDGYAMLSKFEIQDGIVNFTKRYVQSDAYKKAIAAKKPVYAEFSTKGCPGEGRTFFNRVASAFGSGCLTDNASLNLYEVGGEMFACSETCHIHNIRTTDLGTVEANKIDFYKHFGVYMATAHPLRCQVTGDLYNIGTSFKPTPKYHIIRIPKGGRSLKDTIKKSEIVSTIYPSWNTYVSYYHSFAMTKNYIVMLEQPLLMSIITLAEAKLTGRGLRDAMEWTPTERNRFHIVEKSTGNILKTKYYSQEPFFYFHIANAFEDSSGHIIIDINTYESEKILDKMSIEKLRADDVTDQYPSQLQRFHLPIIMNAKEIPKHVNLLQNKKTKATAAKDMENSIVVTPESFGEPGFEGPIVNPNYYQKEHRFVFGTGTCLPGYYANSLCKIDTRTGHTKLWRDASTSFAGEPVFAPPPASVSNNNNKSTEDSGILMAAVSVSQPGRQDFLVFVDAKTMKETARALIPIQVPQAVHGIFLPQ
ncbi:unnamed protein product [Allacma fusca]|uniref:Uncharacterized protein n=1 Tax=Allacma fusca TaxID=39272 RepID=A0A8J2NL16_9HEXA|nr:unnamed protein product [Allacma fusca]